MVASFASRYFRMTLALVAVGLIGLAPAGAQTTLNRRVHAVLIGITDDKNVGQSADYNVHQLKTLFEGGLEEHQLGTIRSLKGKEVNAANIVRTIDSLVIRPDEALFVYFHSHGAHDPNYKFNDFSQGHFFALPGGREQDLLRKDLWQHMRARKAALTALVTESCYALGKASPFEPPRVTYQLIKPNPTLVSLMLNHRGYIDVNACSKDEYSWNLREGSVFTNSFVQMFHAHPGSPLAMVDRNKVRWTDVVNAAGAKASKIFQANRRVILNNPEKFDNKLVTYYRGQFDQRAAILQMNFTAQPQTTEPRLIAVGETVRSALADDDPCDIIRTTCFSKVYRVYLEARQTYMIDMESADIDCYLRLESQLGTNLAEDDDGAGGTNARITFRPFTSGYYYIRATSFAPAVGSFSLRVFSNNPFEVGPQGWSLTLKLTLDDPFDRVRTRCHHKVIDVHLVAGRNYVFELQSATLDSFLRLENSDGVQLAYDDDGGEGHNSRLEFRPTVTGAYRLIATTYADYATGDLRLGARQR